jgi:hypothetical protein
LDHNPLGAFAAPSSLPAGLRASPCAWLYSLVRPCAYSLANKGPAALLFSAGAFRLRPPLTEALASLAVLPPPPLTEALGPLAVLPR